MDAKGISLMVSRWAILVLMVSVGAFGEGSGPLEPISSDRHAEVLQKLSTLGFSVPTGGIVAFGFRKASPSKEVIIVTMDGSGNIKGDSFDTGLSYYQQFMGIISAVDAIGKPSGKSKLDQDGRVYFMIQSSLKSLYVYPYNLSVVFEDMAENVNAGITMLLFSGSVYGSYQFTKGLELGYGRVACMNYGGELGIAYPALLSGFVEAVHGEYETSKLNAWGTMIGYPLGIYLGSRAQFVGNKQYGNASIMRAGGRSAFLYGFLTPRFFYGWEMNDDEWNDYLAASTALTMGLIPVGNYLGYRSVKGHDYSSGRSFLIEASAIMGGLSGILVHQIMDLERETSYSKNIMLGLALAGHAGGSYFGFNFRKGTPYTLSQGLFITLSAAGGIALAEAIPLMADPDEERVYLAAALIGGWGGLVLGERLAGSIFEKGGHDNRARRKLEFISGPDLALALSAANLNRKNDNIEIPSVRLLTYSF